MLQTTEKIQSTSHTWCTYSTFSFYLYIRLWARAHNPEGTQFWLLQRAFVTLTICRKSQKDHFIQNFSSINTCTWILASDQGQTTIRDKLLVVTEIHCQRNIRRKSQNDHLHLTLYRTFRDLIHSPQETHFDVNRNLLSLVSSGASLKEIKLKMKVLGQTWHFSFFLSIKGNYFDIDGPTWPVLKLVIFYDCFGYH